MPTVSVVQFAKPMAPYHAGEKAGFPPDIARFYVEKGFASFVEKDVPQVSPETVKERARSLAAEKDGFAGENAAAERTPAARNRGN